MIVHLNKRQHVEETETRTGLHTTQAHMQQVCHTSWCHVVPVPAGGCKTYQLQADQGGKAGLWLMQWASCQRQY